MLPTLGQKIFKRGESRLFMSAWLGVHLTDALAMASLAVAGKLKLDDDKQHMVFICAAFPFQIHFPIVHPMKLTVSNIRIDTIILEIKTVDPMPSGGHDVKEFPSLHNHALSLIFLRFYEQHIHHIRWEFKSDTKAWPQIFQFAWAIRNAIAHHDGYINFTNENYPPVKWHTLSFSPTDKGNPVFSASFTIGDLFMLMFDLSDELDAIAAPIPTD
jgi:hypothetical protein